MPYKSKVQAAYMHIHHPDIAGRWDKKYGGKMDYSSDTTPVRKRKTRVGAGFQGGLSPDTTRDEGSSSFQAAIKRRLDRSGKAMPSGRTIPSRMRKVPSNPNPSNVNKNPLQATIQRRLRSRMPRSY